MFRPCKVELVSELLLCDGAIEEHEEETVLPGRDLDAEVSFGRNDVVDEASLLVVAHCAIIGSCNHKNVNSDRFCVLEYVKLESIVVEYAQLHVWVSL